MFFCQLDIRRDVIFIHLCTSVLMYVGIWYASECWSSGSDPGVMNHVIHSINTSLPQNLLCLLLKLVCTQIHYDPTCLLPRFFYLVSTLNQRNVLQGLIFGLVLYHFHVLCSCMSTFNGRSKLWFSAQIALSWLNLGWW